jgi:hypothetical protein
MNHSILDLLKESIFVTLQSLSISLFQLVDSKEVGECALIKFKNLI